jgi:hypothetical protein
MGAPPERVTTLNSLPRGKRFSKRINFFGDTRHFRKTKKPRFTISRNRPPIRSLIYDASSSILIIKNLDNQDIVILKRRAAL